MLIALALTATISAATPPVQVAMPGFQVSDLPESRADLLGDFFAQRLTEAGGGRISVVTRSQVASVLGYERQKELLGCSNDSSSCLAELAGALGAEALVVGTIGRIGNSHAVNLKVVHAGNGREVAARSARLDSEEKILDWLDETARLIAPSVMRAFRPSEASELPALQAGEVRTTSGARQQAWIPAAAGGAMLVGGGVLLFLASEDAAKLRDPRPEYSATELVERGRSRQIAGDALIVGGLGALAAAGLMYGLGGPDEVDAPAVALVPGARGGAVVVGGSF